MTISPRLNLNGTSKQELLRVHLDAMQAIDAAVVALAACTPHGRDFQTVANPDVFKAARQQHTDRILALKVVYEQLEQIALDIDQQEGGR
jgi:hypothetical protein